MSTLRLGSAARACITHLERLLEDLSCRALCCSWGSRAASVGHVCAVRVWQECPRRLLPGVDVSSEGLDQSRLGWKETARPAAERSVGPRWPWPGHCRTWG